MLDLQYQKLKLQSKDYWLFKSYIHSYIRKGIGVSSETKKQYLSSAEKMLDKAVHEEYITCNESMELLRFLRFYYED